MIRCLLVAVCLVAVASGFFSVELHAQRAETLESRLEIQPTNQKLRAELVQVYLMTEVDLEKAAENIQRLRSEDEEVYKLLLKNPSELDNDSLGKAANLYRLISNEATGELRGKSLQRAIHYYGELRSRDDLGALLAVRSKAAFDLLKKKQAELDISNADVEQYNASWLSEYGFTDKPEPKVEQPRPEPKEEPKPEPKPEPRENPEPKSEKQPKAEQKPEVKQTEVDTALKNAPYEFKDADIDDLSGSDQKKLKRLSKIELDELELADQLFLFRTYYKLSQSAEGDLREKFMVRALLYADHYKDAAEKYDEKRLQATVMADWIGETLDRESVDAAGALAAIESGLVSIKVEEPAGTVADNSSNNNTESQNSAPPQNNQRGPKRFKNNFNMTLVRIKGGNFTMGGSLSDPNRRPDEGLHQVRITKDFYISRYEVTQAQYREIMGNNPSAIKGDNLPVTNVSWNDAVEFCKRLTIRDKREYRLPTEAEWEYVSRAGSDTPYSSGDTLAQGEYNVSFEGAASSGVWPVQRTKQNKWGVAGMHGNVWEWCQDPYGRYPDGSVRDPLAKYTTSFRVLRGGSWKRDPSYARSARRAQLSFSQRADHIGFRVVCQGH